jgi:hypothetical protein
MFIIKIFIAKLSPGSFIFTLPQISRGSAQISRGSQQISWGSAGIFICMKLHICTTSNIW